MPGRSTNMQCHLRGQGLSKHDLTFRGWASFGVATIIALTWQPRLFVETLGRGVAGHGTKRTRGRRGGCTPVVLGW